MASSPDPAVQNNVPLAGYSICEQNLCDPRNLLPGLRATRY